MKYGTVHIVEDNVDITESTDLIDFEIESNCYVNDRFIGTTVAKKITINTIYNGNYNLENKEIAVSTGISEEMMGLGNYIIPKPDEEEVTSKSKFVAYDYMKKFEVLYIDTLQYPIRLDDYLEALCTQVGVVLGNKNIVNADYMVLGNPFTNGEDCKTVLSNIAQLACGFATIGFDNKLYIVSLSVDGEAEETINGNNYFSFSKNNEYGPVNSLRIQMNSGVDGEESVREEEGLTDETRCQITIADNYFLRDAEQRELVIDKMFNSIKGLRYLPFESEYYGYPYLTIGTKIEVADTDDVMFTTYVLNHKFKYNGAYSGKISATAMTKTQSAYKNTIDLKTWRRNTEAKVDKIEGNISLLASELSSHEEKIEENTAQINIKANEVETSVTDSVTASILTLLNNGYLTAEQVNALVEGNTEEIATIKNRLEQTITDSEMQIAISTAIEGGISYFKNTLFTINDEGLWIATSEDEFNARYDNKGMTLYSYDQMIAKFDVDGIIVQKRLKVEGEIETENIRMMDVVVNGEPRTHIHWIGG